MLVVWFLEVVFSIHQLWYIGMELNDKVFQPNTMKTVALYSATIPLSILMAPIVVSAVIGYIGLSVLRKISTNKTSLQCQMMKINIKIAA